MPLAQSSSPRHALPVPQFAQRPPQSTSLSSLFFTPSLHVTHLAPAQRPPGAQSSSTVHALPAAQRVGHRRPQSTSLSGPSFTPSAQLPGKIHSVQTPAAQMPLAQFAAAVHVLPSGHGAAQEPPQSTSASPVSLTPLSQRAP